MLLVVVAAAGCGSVGGGAKDAGQGGGGGGAGGGAGAGGSGGAPQDGSATDAPAATDAGRDGQPDGGSPADVPAGDAAVRCNQPVSAGACTGLLARSCQELLAWGATADGAYRIDPDGAAGANPPFVTFCEMNTVDQIGWTLMAKVNTASLDSVDEPRNWFITETRPEMLATRTFIDNQPVAAHGAYKFAPIVTASSVARFEIYAALDVTQKATWYKVVTAPSLQVWFTANDVTATRVCTDRALTLNCTDGTIAPTGGATLLNGMNLTPYGYTGDGPIHMRLADDVSPNFSGVCSNTIDHDSNKWKDSYGAHWGNGLLIWLN